VHASLQVMRVNGSDRDAARRRVTDLYADVTILRSAGVGSRWYRPERRRRGAFFL
jgi:hypothetical protein